MASSSSVSASSSDTVASGFEEFDSDIKTASFEKKQQIMVNMIGDDIDMLTGILDIVASSKNLSEISKRIVAKYPNGSKESGFVDGIDVIFGIIDSMTLLDRIFASDLPSVPGS